MLLFSFLWLEASHPPPKPSAKPTSISFQAAAASSFTAEHAARPRTTAVKTPPLQTSPGKKTAPAPKPSVKKPAAKKQQQVLPGSSTPCCFCCCESNSSNAPDSTTASGSFFKPEDHCQDRLAGQHLSNPMAFKYMKNGGFLQFRIDKRGPFFEISETFSEKEQNLARKLRDSRCNANWFVAAAIVAAVFELTGTSYFLWGKDFYTGFYLGLVSMICAIFGTTWGFIKAVTVDSVESIIRNTQSFCQWFRALWEQQSSRIDEEQQASWDRIKQIILPSKEQDEENCCSCTDSSCCVSVQTRAKACLFGDVLERLDIDIENPHEILENRRQELETDLLSWSVSLNRWQKISLLSGVFAAAANAVASTLFLTTTLATQVTAQFLYSWNMTNTKNTTAAEQELRSSEFGHAFNIFDVIKYVSLTTAAVDFLSKISVWFIQGKIERIEERQTVFNTHVQDYYSSLEDETGNEGEDRDTSAISARNYFAAMESARTGKF